MDVNILSLQGHEFPFKLFVIFVMFLDKKCQV